MNIFTELRYPYIMYEYGELTFLYSYLLLLSGSLYRLLGQDTLLYIPWVFLAIIHML